MLFADDTTANVTQWVGLTGATALLVWLLKFARDYQATMTNGAFARIETLEKSIDRLDTALEKERARCDALAARLRKLERKNDKNDKNDINPESRAPPNA